MASVEQDFTKSGVIVPATTSISRDITAPNSRDRCLCSENPMWQLKYCDTLNKDKHRLGIDNFLIILRLSDSFSLPFAVLCTVTEEGDTYAKTTCERRR